MTPPSATAALRREELDDAAAVAGAPFDDGVWSGAAQAATARAAQAERGFEEAAFEPGEQPFHEALDGQASDHSIAHAVDHAVDQAVEFAVEFAVPSHVPHHDPRRPAPAPDRTRHLRSVPARPAPGRRPPRLLVALIALIGVALLVVVSLNVLLGQSGVSESDLERAIEIKQQEVELLELDVLRLSAPSRVHQRAEQLGLVSASDVSYLTPPTAPASASSPLGRGGR